MQRQHFGLHFADNAPLHGLNFKYKYQYMLILQEICIAHEETKFNRSG